MNEIENTIGNERLPSILKDPFQKTKITRVLVSFEDFWGDGKWKASGTVSFSNGATGGQQSFNGATFDEVVSKIKIFINELP